MFSSLGSNHLTAHLTAMKRLAPDPSISISDLMGPFETMFKEMGCWDLLSLVEPPKNGKVTWKSAADPSWLGQRHVSQLFQRLFKVARNGVLASSKVKLALVKLQHQKQRMNFSKLMDDDWQDKVDETLRICAKQYRELKKFPDLYARCLKKASQEEKVLIDQCLGFLKLEEGCAEAGKKGGVLAEDEGDLPVLHIFEKVLSKASSVPLPSSCPLPPWSPSHLLPPLCQRHLAFHHPPRPNALFLHFVRASF